MRLEHRTESRRGRSLGRDVTPPTSRDATPQQVIVKLRMPPPVRAVRGAAGARGALRAADLPAPPEPAALAQLVELGYARRVVPVFPTARADMPLGERRIMAAAATPRTPVDSARGLVSIEVDPHTDPHALAEHLSARGDEIEYAFVPPLRTPFMPATKRARKRPRSDLDPLAGRQWGHAAVRINVARAARGFVDADDIVVAVVDSGIDADHPDLQETLIGYENFIAREDDRDYLGHGTHVAGIIAATINNRIGVAGLCRARILALKGLPRSDRHYDAKEYYRALAHPIDAGAHVVNLSLGGPGPDRAEQDIIADLLDAGIVVVAAMGNEFEEGNPTSYPAAFPGVIAVGAIDEADRRADFSNTGPHITLVAPGVRILSTTPHYPSKFAEKLLYDSWDGTSMATPFVSAAAALLLAKTPSLTPTRVRRRLAATAHRIAGHARRPDDEVGAGRLDIAAALA